MRSPVSVCLVDETIAVITTVPPKSAVEGTGQERRCACYCPADHVERWPADSK